MVSKSGGTPEPQIGMDQVRNSLEEIGGNWSSQAIAITMENSKLDNQDVLYEYYKQTKPHLNNEEIPSFYLDDAILTNYFISIAYKNLKNKKSHIKYKNWAYDQMIELKSRMDIDHQELFMDKWLNKKILDLRSHHPAGYYYYYY